MPEYTSPEKAMEDMMKEHAKKMGPEEPTVKEMTKPPKFMTAGEARKKYGLPGDVE